MGKQRYVVIPIRKLLQLLLLLLLKLKARYILLLPLWPLQRHANRTHIHTRARPLPVYRSSRAAHNSQLYVLHVR